MVERPNIFLSSDYYTEDKCNNKLFETPGFADEIPKAETSLHAAAVNEMSIGNVISIKRYSDIMRLFRVTAFVMRFVYNLKARLSGKSLCLAKYVVTRELVAAQLLWIKDNQIDLNRNYNNDAKLNLNLKLDKSGVVRSYSRLKNANIPFDAKAPIMINSKHKLAELIVYDAHSRVLHRGVKQTLTEIRARYCILRGRNFVKKILHHCTPCKKLNARP